MSTRSSSTDLDRACRARWGRAGWLLLLTLGACGTSLPELPLCERACTLEPEAVTALVLDGARVATVAPGERPVERASLEEAVGVLAELDAAAMDARGFSPYTVYVLCAASTPGARLAAAMTAAGGRYRAVSLGGRQGDGVAFVSVRYQADAALVADVEGGRAVVASHASGAYTVGERSGASLIEAAGSCDEAPICPVVTLRVQEYTCGELLRAVEDLGGAGRLVGFANGP